MKKANKHIRLFLLSIILSFSISAFAQDDYCEYSPPRKAQKQYKEALSELGRGAYYNASMILIELTNDYPDYLQAWWVLGDVNMRLRNRTADRNLAINAFNEVIKLCPKYKDYYAYYYLGNLYFGTEKYEQSYKMYEKFLNAESDRIAEQHFDDAIKYSQLAKIYDKLYKNKVPFDPKIVKDISTKEDEYLAIISPDGEYAYFTRRMEQPDAQRYRAYGGHSGDIERFCFAERLNGIFEKGEPLPKPFNQTNNEGSASLTIDNKFLYYTSCFYRDNNYYDCDIYSAEMYDGYWTNNKPLSSNVNNENSWESMPTITSDGKTLFFTSDREGGIGGYDIYKSEMNENGEWGPAINMGKSINTAGHEKSPFIHTDSQTLYFSSSDWDEKDNAGNYVKTHYGHRGLGGYDIFYTRVDKENSWIEPVNIGYPINSKDGYFASNKLNEDNIWNIYSFALYEKARPKEVLFLKGQLTDEESGEAITDAKMFLKNMKSKEITEIKVDEQTGEYVAAAVFEDDYTLTVKKEEYAYITKYIAKEDKQFDAPVKIDIDVKPIRIGKTYEIEDIFFDTDSDNLSNESYQVIAEFAQFMKDNERLKIEIQGHTDNIGSDQYNIELSNRRAKRVYETLIKYGISSSRMTYKGFGESRPVADNSTEEGRQENRRTEFLITSN
jgi:outer membrane protein OmpA-like peptidoglycan-associated protein